MEWKTCDTQNVVVNTVWVQLPPLAPAPPLTPTKTKYFLGRKNTRIAYRVYKLYNCRWYRASIIKGVFTGWSFCNIIPTDMKPIREQTANEILFEFCL